MGYASVAQEILEQEADLGLRFTQVVVPDGSSGTHAGLAAAFALAGRSLA
jgi:L-cysteate sulfo-lyase